MEFRSKNLLITGGAGFIGSNFIQYVFDNNKEVNIYNLDLLTYAGNLKNTKKFKKNRRYKFIKGDITNSKKINQIFEEFKIDGVINFAAESHVDNSINNPEIFVKTNILGVFNLLNIASKFWMKKPFSFRKEFINARFHQISTDEVYGSIKKNSFSEDSPYRPNSPYSASKASADMLVRSFNKTYGLNTTISLCSNNYGCNQNIEKFVPKIIDCILSESSIPVYGNGSNVRDWIHVNDHCSAVYKIFSKSNSGEVYNVSSNNELSNIDLINKISMYFNCKPKIKFVPDRFGHDFRYSINSKKIKEDLNWKPKFKLIDYLKNKYNFKNVNI